MKAALLDSFWGVERGLNASSDARAEINELISQLEANNPTPMPNDVRACCRQLLDMPKLYSGFCQVLKIWVCFLTKT